MTSFDLLNKVPPGEFIGEYVAPVPGSDEPVPITDIYMSKAPNGVGHDGAKIYDFMPPPGDERDVSDEPHARAVVEDIEKTKDGHVNATLTLAVSGSESAHDALARNPVTEGRSRFTRMFQLLTRGANVDRLLTDPADTKVPLSELQRLGFKAVEGSEMLQLDLPADAKTQAAA